MPLRGEKEPVSRNSSIYLVGCACVGDEFEVVGIGRGKVTVRGGGVVAQFFNHGAWSPISGDKLCSGRSESCPALKTDRTNFAHRFGEVGEDIGVGGAGEDSTTE